VVLADGDLVLLTAQTAGAQNGPWVVRADEWERPDWYPEDGTTQAAAADQFIVLAGTVNGGTSWMIATTGTITIDTTAVAFVQMSIDLSMLNSAGANAEQAMVWDTITGWTPKKLQTCKAWVNFDGVNAALTGVTFSYSGTTITATKAAHGLNVGRLISISGQTGNNAVLNGIWPVKTVPTTGTFTFVVNAAPVGGLVAATVNPYAVRSAFNVSSIDHPSAGVYTVNFETALPDANYTWAILCGISDTGSSSFVTENMVAGVGSLAMRIRNNSDVLANREIVNVMVFGN